MELNMTFSLLLLAGALCGIIMILGGILLLYKGAIFINITEKGIFTGGSIPLAYCGYQISSY